MIRAIIKQNIIIIILEFNYYKLEPSSSIMQEDSSSLLSGITQTGEGKHITFKEN